MAATLKAVRERDIREHNERVLLAWNVAYLSRVKRMTKAEFNKLTVKTARKAKPRQTVEEQMAVMEQWRKVMARVEAQKKRLV